MKKLISLLMASILLLAGCSSGSGSNEANGAKEAAAEKEEVKEITVWAWDPSFNIAAVEKAKEAYSSINPNIEVKVEEIAQNDVIQKLNSLLNSGSNKGLANIVLIEDYRAQSFLSAYPDAFYDMSSHIKAEDFAPYKIGPTSYEGKQYGVPFDSGVTGLYYRTDYLEQAGYKAEDLQNITWKEYIEIGKVVKEKTGKAMLSLDPSELSFLRVMLQSAGSWYVKEDGATPNLTGNETLKQVLQTYKEMMESDIVRVHADWSQFVAGFNGGDVATIPSGNWMSAQVKAEQSQSGKWGIAPIPTLPDNPNSVHASNLGGSSWYVLNVPGAEQAADFLAKTFGSDAELYRKLLTDIGAIGTLKAAASGPAYETSDEFFGGQKVYSDFAAWTEQIPNVNYGMHTYAIEDILIVELQNYLNGKDIDQALNDAQAQAEAQLK